MQEQLEKDLKEAMLAGDKTKAETLRGIKSNILNEAIAQGVKDQGLADGEIEKVLSKESKKRAEAAELYQKAGETARAEAEQAEKAIIDGYLPEQVDEAAIETAVKAEIAKLDSPTMADMGKIIGAVRGSLGAGADGGTIARLVKAELEKN